MPRIKAMTAQELRVFVTDELAQKEGYPNAEVYWLEADLIKLAEKWRLKPENTLVKEYHKLFFRLLDMGWELHLLAAKGLLPAKHMPKDYTDLNAE
jgi:hypothetical protein